MSGGMDEVGVDQDRAEAMEAHFLALRTFLANPTDEGKAAVLQTAERVDNVRGRGYWTGATNLRDGCEERVDRLASGDKIEWGKFLNWLRQDRHQFPLFLELSPFDGGIVIVNHNLDLRAPFVPELLAAADPEFDPGHSGVRGDYVLEIPAEALAMIKVIKVREPRNETARLTA